MSIISPFKGIRYNTDKINSYADVITPPYDVISEKDQEELYNRSEYNLIKLEYGKDKTGDKANNNRYTRAAETFNEWLSDEILIREEKPVFYWYKQEFLWKEKTMFREGLVGTIKLEPYDKKSVLPHEETLSKPKEDRLQLLKHCRANFSPIFGLYPDKDNLILQECAEFIKKPAIVSFKDHDAQVHSLWKLEDSVLHKKIKNHFANWSVFLADGHHRYETALEFSKIEGIENHQGHKYILMFLFNLYDPDLLILPTHRIIDNINNFDIELFFNKLQNHFNIKSYGPATGSSLKFFYKDLNSLAYEHQAIGLCAKDTLYHLVLNDNPKGLSLDVDILQKYIFEDTLHLTTEDLREGMHMTYTRSETEAITAVVNKKAQLSFILNPTPIDKVVSSANQGIRLPQKSTYFFPKLISGLLINKLDN